MKKPFSPFRIHRSKDKQFYFTIVSRNRQVLATSETYTRKTSCIKAIESISYNCEQAWTALVPLYIDETIKK